MPYEDKYRQPEPSHSVTCEGRRRAAVSGVTDVESFDEGEIVINTAMGTLFVRGSDLHIERLSLDSGDVLIDGTIDSLEYEENLKPSGGFFGRLFK
ncbi:MAG: sporulation protein YabP [Oscillospiraceae bacterium]|jgi:sporulation protein YabP|nr:sporulation protein YabP [Oscillospiraceae bacterium]